MKTRLLLLFALSLVLFSCNEKGDEPWNPTANDVTIVALTSGNTLYSMSTTDGQIKTTTIDASFGDLTDLFMHNDEMMLFSKASDGFRMLKFDGNSIVDSKVVDLLNDYIGGGWWVSLSSADNQYCFTCSNQDKYVILDENGNAKEYPKKKLGDEENYSFYHSLSMTDGYGDYYLVYQYYNPSSNYEPSFWTVEKNAQQLFQIDALQAPQFPYINIRIIGNDIYLLGSNVDGNGVYTKNTNVVVDDHFSQISCVCILNGQLCLGGYKIDENKVKRATMKVGGKYYDLTDELGWYEYKDTATGTGNNHSSNVESFMVKNNEIFAVVRKYTQVDPWITGGYDYFMATGDAIFRNTHKVMDLGDKLIYSVVLIPEKN